jgi:hypothetical protein
MAGIQHDFHPGDGNGIQFQLYWTKGEGLSRWATHPHPWRKLRSLLLPHLHGDINFANRLTESYFFAVFGIHSGERFGKNKFGPG